MVKSLIQSMLTSLINLRLKDMLYITVVHNHALKPIYEQ